MPSKKEETKKVVKKADEKAVSKIVKKEAVKKEAPKKISKAVIKEAEEKKTVSKSSVQSEVAVSKQTKTTDKQYATVSIDVVGIDGKAAGKMSLPGEIFGDKVNKPLL